MGAMALDRILGEQGLVTLGDLKVDRVEHASAIRAGLGDRRVGQVVLVLRRRLRLRLRLGLRLRGRLRLRRGRRCRLGSGDRLVFQIGKNDRTQHGAGGRHVQVLAIIEHRRAVVIAAIEHRGAVVIAIAIVKHGGAGIHKHGARAHLLQVAGEAQDIEGTGLLKERGKRRHGVLGDIVGRLDRCGDLFKEHANGVQVGRQAGHRQKHETTARTRGVHNHLVSGKAQVHKRHLACNQSIKRAGDALEQLTGLGTVKGARQTLLQGLAGNAIAHLEHAIGVAHKRAGQQAGHDAAGYSFIETLVELTLVGDHVAECHRTVTLLNNSFFHLANQSSEHARRARKTNR